VYIHHPSLVENSNMKIREKKEREEDSDFRPVVFSFGVTLSAQQESCPSIIRRPSVLTPAADLISS
jgi:hypothetical protein